MCQEHATVDSSAHSPLALALQPININLRALAYFKTAIALLNTCSTNRTIRAKRLNVLIDISFGEYFRRLICLLFGFIEPFPLFYNNLLATFNHIFMGASFPQIFVRYIV